MIGSLDLRAMQGRYGELEKYVNTAQGAAKRAASLTHRLLAFSRRQTLAPKPTDANRLVADMATVRWINSRRSVENAGRSAAARKCVEAGFTVIEAEDGVAALKAFKTGARVDLLITDVGLPNGMNGRQVADAAWSLRPGLKTLVNTGDAENAVLSRGHLDPGMDIVTKPFAMDVLAEKIFSILSKP